MPRTVIPLPVLAAHRPPVSHRVIEVPVEGPPLGDLNLKIVPDFQDYIPRDASELIFGSMPNVSLAAVVAKDSLWKDPKDGNIPFVSFSISFSTARKMAAAAYRVPIGLIRLHTQHQADKKEIYDRVPIGLQLLGKQSPLPLRLSRPRMVLQLRQTHKTPTQRRSIPTAPPPAKPA